MLGLCYSVDRLPPATSKPPFIVDPMVCSRFQFLSLRQNRRVVAGTDDRKAELEDFHQVLTDISWGHATDRVRRFIVEAYVKGAKTCGSAERVELEGSTSVFPKRRFRDRWNRTIVNNLAKDRCHNLKIKARVRARGATSQWFNPRRQHMCRKKSRTQSLWLCHFAGDWHQNFDACAPAQSRHLMRVMLVSNLAVENRFANGTQGRLMSWGPERIENNKKAVLASHPELTARFVKQTSVHRSELHPEIDFMDISPRQETLTAIAGLPVMLQMPTQPCYGLTIHKVQALPIKHIVRGVLEGIFAQGQVYVLVSRVTDPQNFHLLGLPPIDMLEEVAAAWRAEGLDVLCAPKIFHM